MQAALFSHSSPMLQAGTAVIAFLYSSVGHGGASGYLALLSLAGINPDEAATTALMLNLVVAGVSFLTYLRAKHFSFALTWPFVVASLPCAFLGGYLPIPTTVYETLLALTLTFAAIRLAFPSPFNNKTEFSLPSLSASLPIGAAIGLLSGMLGIGGGIFLSPILLLANWADAKKTGATSACFILVNAIAGLLGRSARHALFFGDLTPLLIAALVGGLLGSYFGANKFSGLGLRRLLSVVLILAAGKLILKLIMS